MAKAKHPTHAPSPPRSPARVIWDAFAATLRVWGRRLGHDSGMWLLLFCVTHLVVGLLLFGQVAAFQGAVSAPRTFGETQSDPRQRVETAQQTGEHPVTPLLAHVYGAATLAVWAAFVVVGRRWRPRQRHVLSMLLVPGTLVAAYLAWHALTMGSP